MTVYSTRFGRPIGVSRQGFGGAGANLGIEALAGETDMITVFDDFNDIVKGTDTFGDAAIFEDFGWVLSDDGSAPTGEEINQNDPSNVDEYAPSCLRIFPGTNDDSGGQMQLDLINGAVGTLIGTGNYPHLWIPETAAGAAVLDNSVWTFACRCGFKAADDASSGDWDAKVFIGWAEAGDTSLMTHDDGDITITSGGPLVGFHIPEDGSIEAVSHRTVATAMAEGTNFTELAAAGAVDGTTANGATTAGDTVWFDLALRMDITDMSDDDANGTTTFYHRRVLPTGTPGSTQFSIGGEGYNPWQEHSTKLTNQTPNNDVALVPTIEVLNGPTAGVDAVFFLDWWAFGTSRYSRYSREDSA